VKSTVNRIMLVLLLKIALSDYLEYLALEKSH